MKPDHIKKFRGKYNIYSSRCPTWDYTSSGIYFVTVCTQNHMTKFGKIQNKTIVLNDVGRIVEHCLLQIPIIYPYTYLDECIVMPDHVHFLLHLDNPLDGCCRDVSVKRLYNNRYQPRYSYHGYHPRMSQISAKPGSLSVIIRMFKGATTKKIRAIQPEFAWQSNYHDHIIQTETELEKIQMYIQNNPAKWKGKR